MSAGLRRAVAAAALLRAVLGMGLVAAPRLAPRMLGADTDGPVLGRLLGARDLAVATGTLVSRRHPRSTVAWLVAAVLTDASDAVLAGRGYRRTRRLAPALAVASACSGVAMSGELIRRVLRS
jgi:hypothetical protein